MPTSCLRPSPIRRIGGTFNKSRVLIPRWQGPLSWRQIVFIKLGQFDKPAHRCPIGLFNAPGIGQFPDDCHSLAIDAETKQVNSKAVVIEVIVTLGVCEIVLTVEVSGKDLYSASVEG